MSVFELKIGKISLLLLILATFSCSTASTRVNAPPFKLAEASLSKGIEKGDTAKPVDITDSFVTEDNEVIAYLKLENLSGSHRLRWEWIGADGKTYLKTEDYPIKTEKGMYRKEVTTWHRLPIRGEKAETAPGDWQVKVYMDDQPIVSKDFKLERDIDVDRPPTTAAELNYRNWGIIIGIENYSNLPSVDYAGKDARIMRDYFIKALGIPEENIKLLLDSNATRGTIEGYLKTYLPKNVERDTNLYIYFAGHGVPDVEKGDAYLIPYDGDTRFIAQTGYRLADFYEDLNKIDLQKAIVFMDACFSGAATRGKEMLVAGARPALIHVKDVRLASDKVISINAATGEQLSHSYPEKKHGLFTYFLLRGLKGESDTNKDETIALGELYSYIKDNVSRFSRRKGIEQTPTINPDADIIKGIEGINIGKVIK